MAAVLRGATGVNCGAAGSPASLAIPYPTGVVAGDKLILLAINLNQPTLAADQGFVGDTPQLIGTSMAQVFRKTATGSLSGNVTVTVTGTGARMALAMIAVGTAGNQTENVSVYTGGTGVATIPSVTPAEGSELCVVMSGTRYAFTAGGGSITANSLSLTEDVDTVSTNTSGQMAGVWVGHKTLPTGTAATATGTLTSNATTVAAATWIFAFPTAGVGGSPAPAGWDEVRIFTRT